MVKFSKQLEIQLVPEWKSAFCNYWQLKKDLKQIRLQPRLSVNSPRPSFSSLTFNNLTRRRSNYSEPILVHQRRSVSDLADDLYETELLEPMAQRDVEKVFFARLDEQLNKVNQFYRGKEEEYLGRGEEIQQHFEKLITMRRLYKVHQDYVDNMNDVMAEKQYSDVQFGSGTGSLKGSQGKTSMDVFHSKFESVGHLPQRSNHIDDAISEGEISPVVEQGDCSRSAATENANSSIHSIAFNIPKATPALAISALVQMLWEDMLNQTKNGPPSWRHFSHRDKKKMQYAEKMLRTAFVEFYRGLGLLRSFSSLNMVAFAKILKKYDKITGRDAAHTYMKVVERAYFHSSDKVLKLMDEVERKFTEYFTKGDHRKAMTFLRPMQKRASHRVTFFLGLFTGCSCAFLIAFFVLLHLNDFQKHDNKANSGRSSYMISVYPIFSILALMVLHLYMYGWNLFVWREKRINYAFIFEFATNTEIKYREVLLVATGLTTLVGAGLLGLAMTQTTATASFNTIIIPISILLVFVLLLFCPVNVCYRPSRFFFLRSMKHIIFAPLYKVVMADFFLADQLTSQVYMLRNAEYVMCYYIVGRLTVQSSDVCTSDNIKFSVFAYLFSFLPYWWRAMQCLRRWVDEHERMHLANGGKYVSAMIAAGMGLTYKNNRTTGWLAMFVISSTIATCYQLYWDIVVDWGLLHTKSRNFLLRDQIVLENKNIYFVSMAIDILLRFVWLQSVTRIEIFNLDGSITDLFFASLEVIRRGHWNFYRLENEHLNNVGKFRAVKAIPLPFRGVENDP